MAIFACPGSLAPRDCPTKIDTVIPKPIIGIKASILTLNAILAAANSVAPSLPINSMNNENAAMSRKN